MAEKTGINWCDSTFNGWIGCTRVSPACDHCYAAVSTPVRVGGIKWGPGEARKRTSEANWRQPLKWNHADFRECGGCGWRGEIDTLESDTCPKCGLHEKHEPARRRVFCASLSDWLDNEVPVGWLVDLLDLIRRTPNLDYLLLTKRIGNWRGRLTEAQQYVERDIMRVRGYGDLFRWLRDWLAGTPPTNIWLGSTVVNQVEADRDVPKLLQVPARIRFLSIEPMLEAMRLRPDWITRWPNRQADVTSSRPPLDWIICGGESGPKARPMDEQWCRDLLAQCKAAGVAFHMKQMGGNRDKRGALEDLPEDLRVREFPNAMRSCRP